MASRKLFLYQSLGRRVEYHEWPDNDTLGRTANLVWNVMGFHVVGICCKAVEDVNLDPTPGESSVLFVHWLEHWRTDDEHIIALMAGCALGRGLCGFRKGGSRRRVFDAFAGHEVPMLQCDICASY